ncbi:MAG: UDP-N-acetylmuramoyl-tripeptide--D-alanyl-D-alanine ligase, partial [Eubacterium sp.]|nr:UDP-N-acetylmuramoyl-tripeptide--D-alanyl-D-alanine ligase [Eubacterium sp.]
ITNIGVSHIENLGSREGILKAKTEILSGMKHGYPLILSGDDDMLQTVDLGDAYPIITYAVKNTENADFIAENIIEKDGKTTFTVLFDNGNSKQKITIPTIGIHNVYNALAAFTVGYMLQVDYQAAADALAAYVPEGMRQKSVAFNGITCIEDCYNASPDSMKAALTTLANTEGKRKIAVLADMLELGEYSKQAHMSVGEMVAQNKIDYLFAYGEMAEFIVDTAKDMGMKNAYHFDNKAELCEKLIPLIEKGDTIVFKASRGMKLEDVINKVYEVKKND